MDEHRQGTDREASSDASRDVAAAAAVHAAKRAIDGAIAELAASPLDVDAADRMRQVLASPRMRKARNALGRLQPGRRPHLSVVAASSTGRTAAGQTSESPAHAPEKAERPQAVPDPAPDFTAEAEEPASAIAGGVA